MSDLEIAVMTKQRVPVKYLRAEVGARYWEDAAVNGVEDSDGKLIPLRNGDNWCPVIDLATGKIENWPAGTTADLHYKSCDENAFELLDAEKSVVVRREGYVINMMCPEPDGFGDYVIMHVGADGVIANWKVDLRPFETDEDED